MISSTPPRETSSLDILVVDDEPDILDSLESVLARQGHRVTAARDGGEAMGCLDSRVFDVAICDVRLPRVDGFEIFRRIRLESPRSQVILMSAYGNVAEAVDAMKDRAAHYLAKPFSVEVLLGLVDRIAEEQGLRSQLERLSDVPDEIPSIIGETPSVVRLRELIQAIAKSDASVLITGESGTGKELVARALHSASPRADKPLVTINCAAFPETLLEAELFGHEQGAFTGAAQRRAGRFEAADGGTLFLDEVAEMAPSAQAKLLRVLEEGSYQRLGSNDTSEVDVRIISATNIDVQHAVDNRQLRADIFHRLKVFHLHVPPLRERRHDLLALIKGFHRQICGANAADLAITPAAWAALRDYSFPGNIRELKHVVEHALILSAGQAIDLDHLPEDVRGDATPSWRNNDPLPLADAMHEFERELLLRALQRCAWHRARTAGQLGISRKTLWQKLKIHGIEEPDA